MAEMAVSFAIDTLLPLVTEEVNLLKGIHKDFADIKRELEYIQAFIKDAERKVAAEGENAGEGVKVWLKEVREAALLIEDIIDEYMIHVGQKPHDPGCAGLLKKTAHFLKTLIPRRRIASEIQRIKSFVQEIRDRSNRYNLQSQPSSEKGSSSYTRNQNVNWYDPRMASLYMEDAELVGFEAPRDELIGWLVEGSEECIVYSVVGMGGQGKTTLANRVFKNQKVFGHFDCHAWITVSESYNLEGLLMDMLTKFCRDKREEPPQNISEMDQDSLIQAVQNYLRPKRYLIVFDDVWAVQFWDKVKFALIDNKKGSRILITTRNMEVAMSSKNSRFSRVHELQPLTPEKSLELFYKKAFQFDCNGCCPADLVDISSKIVGKCNGLPLAIVVMGALLSRKEKTESEWKSFVLDVSSKLQEKDSPLFSITKILGFSYDDLPDNLKACLLYFGMYPEDYEVRSKRLIKHWVAEGFVKHRNGKTLEEVAEQYLTDLVDRRLVQASSFSVDKKVKRCRVHDLTREMIFKKCKELNFCHLTHGHDNESIQRGIVRRQSVATSNTDCMESIESSHVKSLLFFTPYAHFNDNYVKRLLKKYKLLKILDFEDVRGLNQFPKPLGSLIHLKYLSFRGTSIKESRLPRSIGKLHNLETLNIKETFIKFLPKEICKLKKLRHLVGKRLCLNEMKDGIGEMTSLRTLKVVYISGDDDAVELIKQMTKLTQLRHFSLYGFLPSKHGHAVCSLLNNMQQLEKLHIRTGRAEKETVALNSVSVRSMCKHVRKLYLSMKLNENLLGWVQELRHLVKLRLQHTMLTNEELKSLQNLPNLLYLCIDWKAYSGECMHFEGGGFQNLKELHVRNSFILKSIKIDKGAMNSLEQLTLSFLPKLERVPNGIQYLTKLQHLTIYMVPMELKERVAEDEGEDRWIIHHVPHVDIR